MKRLSVHDIEERIRRTELRLEQFLVARDLAAPNGAAALAADVQVNACVAMLAYLRFLLRAYEASKQRHTRVPRAEIATKQTKGHVSDTP
jgi:hypothetical protein